MRWIGLLGLAIILAIALWLVFVNPGLFRGAQTTPNAITPAAASSAANAMIDNQMADDAAQKAKAISKAKAAKAKAEALAAERAVEAAQANALQENMTPAQNRLTEDYAAQVGDTRPAASDTGNASTPPD